MRKAFYLLLDLLLLRAWHIKKAIREWKKGHKRDAQILDAGSGFGQYSFFLSKQSAGWHITGVDVKTEQIEDCNRFFTQMGKKDQVKFRYADLTSFTNELAYRFDSWCLRIFMNR